MVKKVKKGEKNEPGSLTRLVVKEFGRVHDEFKLVNGKLTNLEKTQDLQFKIVTDEISRINDNVKDIKGTLRSVTGVLGPHDREMEDFKTRLSKVERKVGIEK
ncbi:MAG: hypothetical protein Q7T49_00980 [bacterium]|nr:hypothetical protein [bacterium]